MTSPSHKLPAHTGVVMLQGETLPIYYEVKGGDYEARYLGSATPMPHTPDLDVCICKDLERRGLSLVDMDETP